MRFSKRKSYKKVLKISLILCLVFTTFGWISGDACNFRILSRQTEFESRLDDKLGEREKTAGCLCSRNRYSLKLSNVLLAESFIRLLHLAMALYC